MSLFYIVSTAYQFWNKHDLLFTFNLSATEMS